jgi:hypothetical protein
MANEEHLAQLKQGVAAWNQWRKGHSSVLRQRCASAFQRAWGTAQTASEQTLLVKSRWVISNVLLVRVTRGMSAISPPFKHSMQGRFSARH